MIRGLKVLGLVLGAVLGVYVWLFTIGWGWPAPCGNPWDFKPGKQCNQTVLKFYRLNWANANGDALNCEWNLIPRKPLFLEWMWTCDSCNTAAVGGERL